MIQYRRENEPNIEELREDLKYFRDRCKALEKENDELKTAAGHQPKKTG
jgi:hypothetical protein